VRRLPLLPVRSLLSGATERQQWLHSRPPHPAASSSTWGFVRILRGMQVKRAPASLDRTVPDAVHRAAIAREDGQERHQGYALHRIQDTKSISLDVLRR
jgi:hypothetical protein